TVTMVKKGKNYLIDHRSSTVRRLNKDLAKKIELPSGYLNATKNLVNLDEYNYMPFFEDFYMEDYIYAEPNLLWLEENGDVVAEIWINNGLDQDQHYTKGQLICQDDSLGEIIHFTTDVDVQVKKNSSATTPITIPADQVKSGDQSWTYINASVALISE
ncbi:MAG: hypothetical protein J6D18_00505, partial [Erysipelotrichaceae bacterium]|nr:hypothetical protein [Erysipelotrichaceae bacterium]